MVEGSFTNVARWGVQMILEAADPQQVAQDCFPGIKPEEVGAIIDNPQLVLYSADGNSIVAIGRYNDV